MGHGGFGCCLLTGRHGSVEVSPLERQRISQALLEDACQLQALDAFRVAAIDVVKFIDLVDFGGHGGLGVRHDAVVGREHPTDLGGLVASADSLAARGTPLKPADMAQHEALTFSTVRGDARWQFGGTLEANPNARKSSARNGSSQKKSELQSVLVRGPLRSNSLSALPAAARGRVGVAALQAVLTDFALPVQEIHAVFPSPRWVLAKVSGFVAWLQTELDEQCWKQAG